jgi:hypothetical protein
VPLSFVSFKEVISIDRRVLNELLIEGAFASVAARCRSASFVLVSEASKRDNIHIHFEHKFVGWNRETKIAAFDK